MAPRILVCHSNNGQEESQIAGLTPLTPFTDPFYDPFYDLSLFRPGNEQVIDLRLFSFTTTADFPYVDAFGVGRHTKQHVRIDQIVIDHYIGLAQKFHRFDCEQTRIPWPGTDEIDLSRLRQTR